MRHKIGYRGLALDVETAVELLLHEFGGEHRLKSILRWCHGYSLYPSKYFTQRILKDMQDRGLIVNCSHDHNALWRWRNDNAN